MALTALEIKDKTFGVKFRGYDANEVEEFLDIVVRDYEDLVRLNHDQESKIQALEERLNYFDEMKDSLSQSVLIAQDTAERVKQAANERSENIVRQAEQDAQHLVDEAKQKANEILRHATDNAKKVAVETEELKNKTRVFHQRLKSTIESQLSIIDTPEWDEILRPTAMYIQTSDEAFREIVEKALGESVHHHHAEDDNIDLTRQFSPAEIEELQKRIEAANLELGATQAFEGLNEKVQSALEEAEHARHENEEVVEVEETVQPAANERSENIVRQAEQDAQHLVDEAKQKANEILRHATDNAKKVAVETEELKNKTRVFHQRLKSTIESQLSIIDTPEWDEILRPTAMYIQTSDEAFREIVEKALGESVHHHHAEDDNIDLTRQFSPAEIEELQKRIEAANLELGATQAFEGLNEKVQSALEEAEHARHENEEVVEVEETVQPDDDANRESVNIL